MEDRIQITRVAPAVDAGRYAAKSAVGHRVPVSAVVFREGHDLVAASVRIRMVGDDAWTEVRMDRQPGDLFRTMVPVDRNGPWEFEVLGWTDRYATWLDGLDKKHRAGVADLSLELEEGALLLERHAAPDDVSDAERAVLRLAAAALRDDALPVHQRVEAAADEAVATVLATHPDRRDLTTSPTMPLWVDRALAASSAWYEFFPRSIGSDGTRSGTFSTAAERLPAVAEMGYDVVYLPPIHPIGRSHRKGPNNTLIAGPDDPGVPWAIGSEDGGHTDVHPDLGTLEDFDAFVATARSLGLEVALDYAIQCSPDHPWVTEHPEWFRHRADGSIRYAENPPKKYQDIYPIDFDTTDIDGLCAELKRILEFWIDRGIEIFRVDNPHTKALPFWEWVIAEIRRDHPGVIFLAEAFTRPQMMQQLAKLGFNQSYTYYTWRPTAVELREYVTELAHGDMADYYRPNFWPNTPDILHEYLQTGRPAAFKIRLALAGLLSPNYGVYSGYELLEHTPVRPGSEEYLDSEKYAYRPRDFDQPHSIAPFMTRINEIRKALPDLLGHLGNIWFHDSDNPELLVFSKVPGHRRLPGDPPPDEALIVVATTDQHHPQSGWVHLDLWQLGLEGQTDAYDVHDLMTGTIHTWQGADNWVGLDPDQGEPLHVLHLTRR
jgi:starch synthase (maltosyl-transferring)